ncbi:MAG: hypothetical protein KF697_10630 [Pseudolabrys sp.]|nr:hypothetical protein [Pseudolabrys sp.]
MPSSTAACCDEKPWRRAFECCVVEWLNRNPARSPSGRCLGCGESEHAHDKLLPFGTEPSYAPRRIRAELAAWHAHAKYEVIAALATMGIFATEDEPMTGKKTAKEAKPATVVANDPDDLKGRLKNIGGSQSDHWNNILANQAVQALWLKNSSAEERDKQLSATVAALICIAPKAIELEGDDTAPVIAAHNAAMECYRRAMIGEQTFEGRRENLAQANKLSRSFATLLEALNRHRGKGQQKVDRSTSTRPFRWAAGVGGCGGGGVVDARTRRINPMQSRLPGAPQPAMRRLTRNGFLLGRRRWRTAAAGCIGARSPGAPKGNRNALKHGRYTAESGRQSYARSRP